MVGTAFAETNCVGKSFVGAQSARQLPSCCVGAGSASAGDLIGLRLFSVVVDRSGRKTVNRKPALPDPAAPPPLSEAAPAPEPAHALTSATTVITSATPENS
jgi:hypothetical protein